MRFFNNFGKSDVLSTATGSVKLREKKLLHFQHAHVKNSHSQHVYAKAVTFNTFMPKQSLSTRLYQSSHCQHVYTKAVTVNTYMSQQSVVTGYVTTIW